MNIYIKSGRAWPPTNEAPTHTQDATVLITFFEQKIISKQVISYAVKRYSKPFMWNVTYGLEDGHERIVASPSVYEIMELVLAQFDTEESEDLGL